MEPSNGYAYNQGEEQGLLAHFQDVTNQDIRRAWRTLAGENAAICLKIWLPDLEHSFVAQLSWLAGPGCNGLNLMEPHSLTKGSLAWFFRRSIGTARWQQRQWLGSRSCLLDAARSLQQRGLFPDNFLGSLSHTRGAAVAVARSGHKGVGVDLEPVERFVPPAAIELLAPEPERRFQLSALEYVIVKEAVLKSHHCCINWLGDFQLSAYDPISGRGRANCCKCSALIGIQLIKMNKWLICFAVEG